MKRIFIFSIILVLCLSTSVEAHRLHIIYKISEIEIQAYYAGGTPCRDANVKVYDSNGNLYIEGVTDDEGKFRFPPKTGVKEYKVVVEAVHMPGHKAETMINLTQETTTINTEIEMPLYSKVIAGFGYLSGLAGIAMIYAGWKMKKKYKGKEQE